MSLLTTTIRLSRNAREPSLLNPARQLTSPAFTIKQPFITHSSRQYSSPSSSSASSSSSLTQSPTNNRRTALITGSSRGIGASIALRLASDGFNICIHDHPSQEPQCQSLVSQIQTSHPEQKACYAIGDVSSRADVENIIATSVKELGDLDVMVANAGIAQVRPALDVTEEDMRRMFEVNVFGLVNCYIAAGNQMILQQQQQRQKTQASSSSSSKTVEEEGGWGKKNKIKGKIIGAASIAAFKPTPLLAHYTASKFAVRGLTQSYAVELAEHGITVNAYAPGIVGTQMWDLIDAEMAKHKGMQRGEVLRKMVMDNTALGRVSVPEDVAGLVSFLAGEGSDFVTGQTLVVDGGIVYT